MSKRPEVLTVNSSLILGNASWLQQQLGTTNDELWELLVRCPHLLASNITDPDWAAKLEVLEGVGIDRQAALAKYSGYLSSALPTLASSLALWRAWGSPQPLSLAGLLQHKAVYFERCLRATKEQWAAFQARYFGSEEWHQLCARRGLDGDEVVAAWRARTKRPARAGGSRRRVHAALASALW